MKGIALALGFSLMLGTRLSQQELIALLVSTAFCVLLVMAAKFLFPVWLGGLPTIGPMLLFLMAIAMGSVYGHGWLQDRLSSRLPTVQDRSEAKVIVQVTSLQEKSRWSRLELAVLCQERGSKLPQLKRLQLNYYEKSSQKGESELNAAPEVGQILQVHALLRAIRNFENGLAFDYEAYQLRRGIDARGHIKHLQSVELASLSEFENCNAGVVSRAQGSASKYLLEQRSQWIEQLESRLGSHAGLAKGWIMGLVFGEATAFTAEQWRLAQATGTLHLLVVSGLHLGAFALAAVGFSGFLARIIAFFGFSMGTGSRMLLRQLLIAMIALGYVLLAGAGIALQRAWVMLALLLLLLLLSRRLQPAAILCYAFALVLLVNPLIYTGAGFWFSFAAVGSLVLYLQGRNSNWIDSLWLPQLVVFLALLPIILFWDQVVSLSHLPSNLLAIPLMVFWMLPLTGVTTLALFLLPDTWLSEHLVGLLQFCAYFWWRALEVTASLHWPVLYWLPNGLLVLWVGLMATVFWGVRPALSIAGGVILLALLWLNPVQIDDELVMVDVGQGLAVVATQNGKIWGYDTGARFSEAFNAGTALVLPVVRRLAGQQFDELIVSHSDNDHSGGLMPILESGFPVRRLWLGQESTYPLDEYAFQHDIPQNDTSIRKFASGGFEPVAKSCHSEQDVSPMWIRVSPTMKFRFFHIPGNLRVSDNNHSCVVQLEWFQKRILLTGDADVSVEMALVRAYGSELVSDILVAGHHGSRSSSSEDFLRLVSPREVWVSAGWHNRYGHPAQEVLERIASQGAIGRNTADSGAIRMKPSGLVVTERELAGPIWRQH